MTKVDRRIVKWVIFWICLSLLFIFFSNIFMHLFSYQSGNADHNVFKLQGYKYCEIAEDGQYVHTDYAPIQLNYSIDDLPEEISQICIDFGKPVGNFVWLDVYYPDEQGNYPEESVVKERLVPGLEEHVIDVEPGKYHEIRIDFDQSIYIKDVHAGGYEKKMLYADKAWRHRIWRICFLFSFFLSAFLYCFKTCRIMWEKLCQSVKAFAVRCYRSIDLKKIRIVLLGGMAIGGCLEMVAMLLSYRGFNGKEAIIFSAGAIIVLSFFIYRNEYLKKLELMSLVIFLLLGSVFICMIPVSLGISWDDDTHYYRIISLARCFDGTITEADDVFIAKCYEASEDEERYQKEHRKQNARWYNEKYQRGTLIDKKLTFNYKDIPYLPFVVGIWTAYGLGLSFCATVLLAKLFQLFLIGMLLYGSMKNVRSGKLLIMVFAMVPTVLFEAVSYTYDSWLTFFLIYAFSRYFGELQRKDEKLTFAGFCSIFVPAFLGLLPKIVYAPMLFLMAYMPKSKWRENKWRIAYYACFVCAALIVVFGIRYIASGQMSMGSGDVRGTAKSNGDQQLQYIIHHFDIYCHTLLVFLREYLSYDLSSEYLTYMAHMGILHMQYVTIALLLAAAFWDRSSLDKKTIPVISKVAALIMPGIIAAICATVMYIAFTAVGLDRINGCQGRYLLPAIFPTIFMISRSGAYTGIRKKIPIEIGNMALLFFNVWFLLYQLWIYCASKY